MIRPRRIIDAHIHLWDPSVLAYRWLEPGAALRRAFLPVDLHRGGAPTQWVMVQAEARPDQDLAELQWISGLAAREPPCHEVTARAPQVRKSTEVRQDPGQVELPPGPSPIAWGRRLDADRPEGMHVATRRPARASDRRERSDPTNGCGRR